MSERPQRTLARLRREEGAFTLPELLVGLMIALVVVAGAMMVVQFAVKAQPRASDRAAQIQQGRTTIERITRELRQGEAVYTATSTNLELLTMVDRATCGGASASSAIACRVRYTCSGSSCTRAEQAPSGAWAAAQTVASGLREDDVFTYEQPTPATGATYVGVALSYPAEDGGEAVTLTDGAALRNYAEQAAP